jgi:tRNA 2-thiouridine synthesizing protein A
MADRVLDARGMNCPLPVLKAKLVLRDLDVGGTLEVLATDPGSVSDFAAFCRMTGHILLESGHSEGHFRYLLKKAGSA